ncbi:hypothetical protein ACIBI9_49260 [Nonomuraea sp. NPDC050451]|uniref:hypothetical protein n=1 Tax=Nonomuraea sp. NPDC050451 TaxID=3364364 RepID=UPI003795A37F
MRNGRGPGGLAEKPRRAKAEARGGGLRLGIVELYGLGMLALAVVCAYFAVLAVAPEIRAARGEGTAGTFTAEHLECSEHGICSWEGSFRSDDGGLRVADAWIHGPGEDELSAGDQAPALYTGHDGGKVYAPGSHDLWALGAFFVVDLLFAGYALTFFPGVRLTRRLKRP